jgi:hypothetical protein
MLNHLHGCFVLSYSKPPQRTRRTSQAAPLTSADIQQQQQMTPSTLAITNVRGSLNSTTNACSHGTSLYPTYLYADSTVATRDKRCYYTSFGCSQSLALAFGDSSAVILTSTHSLTSVLLWLLLWYDVAQLCCLTVVQHLLALFTTVNVHLTQSAILFLIIVGSLFWMVHHIIDCCLFVCRIFW